MGSATTSGIHYDSADFETSKSPWALFKRMRDEEPLYYNAERDFFAVSRFDDVTKVLADSETYINKYGGTIDFIKSGIEIPPGTVLFEDDPAHGIHRALLSRMFTPKKVAALDPQIRKFCTDVLDSLDAKAFDFATDIGDIVPMRVIGMLLGIPVEQQEEFRDRLSGYGSSDDEERGQRIFDAEVFIDYVKWRQQNPSDDVVTELLTAEFDDEEGERRTLTLDELMMYVNVLAAAGNETTGRLITYCGKLLADFPDDRRKLVEDPGLIPSAVEEVLRYEPPAIEAARYVTKDVEMHGVTMPAGSCVSALLASANRDERHYDEPDRFDIRRRAQNLSLSFGAHYCLGANLARIEARIVLAEILKRYPEWEVDTDNAVYEVSPPLRSWSKLPVVVPG